MHIKEIIEQKLQAAFQIHLLEVVDETAMHQGDRRETHFRILIVSSDF